MTSNQIADRIILLRSNAEAQADDDAAAGARLKLARFVIENEKTIVQALRKNKATSKTKA